MSSRKTVELNFKPNGTVTVKTNGFAGAECKDATKAVEKALGLVLSDADTPEMFQEAVISENVEVKGS